MPRYYVTIRPLCTCCFPLRITRYQWGSVAEVDPRATKAEMLERAYQIILPWEHEAARRAYGQPPPGEHMEDSFVDGAVLPYVPPYLRLPGEPAIQHPDLTTISGREAYLAALEWAELEIMAAQVAQVS